MEDFKQVDFKKYKFKEDFFGYKCDIKSLEEITKNINNCFKSKQDNFLNLCVSLRDLKNLFLSDKAYYHGFACEHRRFTFDSYVQEFGFEVRYVEKCIQCANKFILGADVGGYEFVPQFKNYSSSKLFELLPLSYEQLEKDSKSKKITSDMTVKQIREYVKSLKGTEKKENQVLEKPTGEENVADIDYNPNKHHDRKYFESLSKEELVEIVLQLQDCYESLLEDED